MKIALFVLALSLVAAQSQAAVEVFSRAPNGGGLIPSSWVWENGSDADMYAYDDFTLPADASITQVKWRGSYAYGGIYGGLVNFSITVFDSITGGSQPLCGHPEFGDSPYIYKKVCDSLCNPVAVGGGLYDYSYTLPVALSLSGNHKYWLRIEGYQIGYPDWSISNSAQGNGAYFRFSTGAAMFQAPPGNTAFTLMGNFPSTAVSGTIALGNWVAPLTGVGVAIDLVDASNNVLETQPGTLNASGGYTFNTTRTGSVRFRVRSDHFLSKTVGPYTLSGAPVSGVNALLVNGDADGSGEVDAADIDVVILNFGSADPWADLDGSGEVDAADIDIAILNFGAVNN